MMKSFALKCLPVIIFTLFFVLLVPPFAVYAQSQTTGEFGETNVYGGYERYGIDLVRDHILTLNMSGSYDDNGISNSPIGAIYSPNGDLLGRFDNSAALTIVAPSTGNYIIEITWGIYGRVVVTEDIPLMCDTLQDGGRSCSGGNTAEYYLDVPATFKVNFVISTSSSGASSSLPGFSSIPEGTIITPELVVSPFSLPLTFTPQTYEGITSIKYPQNWYARQTRVKLSQDTYTSLIAIGNTAESVDMENNSYVLESGSTRILIQYYDPQNPSFVSAVNDCWSTDNPWIPTQQRNVQIGDLTGSSDYEFCADSTNWPRVYLRLNIGEYVVSFTGESLSHLTPDQLGALVLHVAQNTVLSQPVPPAPTATQQPTAIPVNIRDLSAISLTRRTSLPLGSYELFFYYPEGWETKHQMTLLISTQSVATSQEALSGDLSSDDSGIVLRVLNMEQVQTFTIDGEPVTSPSDMIAKMIHKVKAVSSYFETEFNGYPSLVVSISLPSGMFQVSLMINFGEHLGVIDGLFGQEVDQQEAIAFMERFGEALIFEMR